MTRHDFTRGAELNEGWQKVVADRYANQRHSLDTLREALEDQRQRAADFIADTRSVSIVPVPEDIEMLPVAEIERNNEHSPHVAMIAKDPSEEWFRAVGPVTFNAHANGQIRQHIAEVTRTNGGTPTLSPAFYRWLLANEPEHFASLVNRLFERTASMRMFRVLLDTPGAYGTGHARAFVSNKYRRLDAIDAMDAVHRGFEASNAPVNITRCGLTDLRVHVEAMFPTLSDDIRVGDPVALAAKFTASDVAAGAIDLSFGIERFACSNLLIVSEYTHRQIHIGKEQSELVELLMSEETKRLEDKLIFDKLHDVARGMASEEMFAKLLTTSRKAADELLPDPMGASQLLTANVGLTQDESAAVQAELVRAGDPTMWGLTNALTATARTLEYERKAELEKAAGQLLHKSDAWKAYREAEAKDAA